MNVKTVKPNKLRELRLKAGLTQTELAKALDFNDSQDRICKWEKGIAMPSIPNLFKLSKFYNVAPNEIYPEF